MNMNMKTKMKMKILLHLLSIFTLLCCVTVTVTLTEASSNTVKSTASDNNTQPLFSFAEQPDVVYHNHVAKTAGSELVKMVARTYLGVCSNKEMSWNQPLKDSLIEIRNREFIREDKSETMHNMHNCKFISLELPASSNIQNIKQKVVGKTKTLLVPCRDAWDHAMSWCNYKEMNPSGFKCEELDSKCMNDGVFGRYDRKMVNLFDWVYYYDISKFDNLVDDLSSALPHRPMKLETSVLYSTNRDRNKSLETFGKQCKKSVGDKLVEQHDYFADCKNFLYSQNRTVFRSKVSELSWK